MGRTEAGAGVHECPVGSAFRLTLLGDLSAILPGVRDHVAEPEGQYDDRNDPQYVKGETD
jgi:hypothetical protein